MHIKLLNPRVIQLTKIFFLFTFLFVNIQQAVADFIFFPGNQKSESVQFFINGQAIDSLFKQMQTMVYSNPDEVRRLTQEAIVKAQELHQYDWEVRLLNLIGASYAIKSEYSLALEYYYKALEKATQEGCNTRLADTYNNLGGVQYVSSNYPEALANYLEALNYYEKDTVFDKIAGVHCNIGLLYFSLKNPEKSKSHFRKALVGFKKLKIYSGQTLAMLGNSRNYLAALQYDSAFISIDSAIDLSKSIHDIYSLSSALKMKGDVFFVSGDYVQSLDFYRQSEIEALQIENKSILGDVYESAAKTFLAMGNLHQAILYSNKALEMAQIVSDRQTIVGAHLLMSKIMETKGAFQQALFHYQTATELSNKILDESKLHGIYNMEIQHLTKDKEVQRLEIERQQFLINKRNTTIYIIILISLFIIVLVASIYYYYANKVKNEQRRRVNEAILKATEERSKIALEAEIQERKQLGLELHDRVGPLLSLAKLNLTAVTDKVDMQDGVNRKILNNTLDTINEILKEIKQISQNMAPVVLIEMGFVAAIKSLVIRLNETLNYRVSLDMFEINGKLELYVEHVLYRSILEILNNILSHANGTEITIQIIGGKEDITAMIEDNGQGFDTAIIQQNKGLGLKSTQHRIESLKGSMFVDSKIGKGTIVTFIVPIQTKESNTLYESDIRLYY